MSIFNPTFLLGLVLLLYLSSFVLFAILRIATGISIQRIGYFSLRRIAYTPRDGIRIDLRALGLHLHRPTFSRPTWISLRLLELKVSVDVKVLGAAVNGEGSNNGSGATNEAKASGHKENGHSASPKPILRPKHPASPRSRAWKRLTQLKERIKLLHEKIHWLKLVDVVALNSTIVMVDVGSFEVGVLNMVVDTRRKTVDRGRLFRHKKTPGGDQWPAEWMFTVRGVFFTPEGKDSQEVADICSLNIHGLLYRDMAGLRDASIALKLGRVHIPYDDLVECHTRFKELQETSKLQCAEIQHDHISLADAIEELDRPGSREANIVQTVSDSKEFVSSILRGIQEIQMAISFLGVTKGFPNIQPSGVPLYINAAMNEFGIDMHRLDPKSPAHRMYFSPKDIAHQALLAAISIAVSIDDGHGKPERVLYIPMATTTIKTTFPSKTVAFSEDQNAAERNTNMLFGNLVLTSPSVDVDPKIMPLILALAQQPRATPVKKPADEGHSQRLLSRLLPKANIKLSVHEPVARVALPPADPKLRGTDEYDLLICAVSSISFDAESSHSAAGELHYALISHLRISSHQLYYHTASGERHNLLLTDALDLKVQVNASPTVCVVASGSLQTFSVHMVRPEISTGVRQIVQQLKKNYEPEAKVSSKSSKDPDFLRPLPPWLVQVSFSGSNFAVEVAGVDPDVSEKTRGVALQLESWTAEYKLQRASPDERPQSRRRAIKKTAMPDEPAITVTAPSNASQADPATTDGRRLAIHVRSLEGFVVEGIDSVEQEPFLSLPRFEVAFSTSSDTEGPIFHLNSHMKALYLQYSLYRYYATGVASIVLRKAFARDKKFTQETPNGSSDASGVNKLGYPLETGLPTTPELFAVDVKIEMLQIKAKMPADPPMMLQVFGVEAGSHRWAKPFMKSRVLRLCAEAPRIRGTWARFVSAKGLRVDLREVRKKRPAGIVEERSLDVVSDFIRIAVPHGLVLHKLFDNFANTLKATEQLHHRFKTGNSEYILEKRPQKPKKVPRVSIRSKALLFDIEDGPFDWKLGTIYRIGLIEQKQRLAREEAFQAKVKHMENVQRQQQGSSKYRAQSADAQQRSKPEQAEPQEKRGRRESADRARHRSESPSSLHSRWMRYNPEGRCSLSKEAKITTKEALRRLQMHNAQSWKKRIDRAYHSQNAVMHEIRGIFWGSEVPHMEDGSEKILGLPNRPGLMSTLISDLHILIDKPSFPLHEYPQFLHRVGKGMPYDMEYSLLIPLNIQINMGEARVTLRDYPLPLLHVPAIRPGQSPRLPSWSLKSDFIIAEEYRGAVSVKQVKIDVIPPENFSSSESVKGFAIDVSRTVSPVKTYSDVDIAINTSAPTKFTWGTSYQPAIQDMMMIIEGFTKPQVDPSDRVGFWDKIRLNAHSRVKVDWKGDGDVHLQLKGIWSNLKSEG